MGNKFIAKYEENGIKKTIFFDKIRFDQPKAEAWLENQGIKNFFFFFEPNEPTPIGENGMLLSGDVGFDITLDSIMPLINSGKDVILDTFGGDSWEGLKIHDTIKAMGINPSIGILGSCMSAGMQILLSTENRWMSPNSRGLIHNPWAMEAGDDAVMFKAAKELENEKIQIAKIYSQVSGKSLDDILELMKKETILRADEMLALNFVKSLKWGEYENEIVLTQNDEKMNEEGQKKLNAIESLVKNLTNRISNLFPPKNIVLQDVNGVELDFGSGVETPEQITIGSTAMADGSPAVGEYVMEDGTVYVFEAGAVIEIREPEQVDPLMEENEKLQAEVAELQSQLEGAQNKVATMTNEIETAKTEILKVQTAFNDFKNSFSKETPKPNTPPKVEGQGVKKFTFNRKKY